MRSIAKPIFVSRADLRGDRRSNGVMSGGDANFDPQTRLRSMLSDFSAPICLAACQKSIGMWFSVRDSRCPRSGQTQRWLEMDASRAHRQSPRRRS